MRLHRVLPCAVVALVCGGACAAEPAPPPREVVRYTARITSTDKGAIEKITLRGDGIAKELDLKADVAAFGKKLAALAANKDTKIDLTLEIDGKLIQEYVVQLIDASIKAGIEDVSPILLDPKKP